MNTSQVVLELTHLSNTAVWVEHNDISELWVEDALYSRTASVSGCPYYNGDLLLTLGKHTLNALAEDAKSDVLECSCPSMPQLSDKHTLLAKRLHQPHNIRLLEAWEALVNQLCAQKTQNASRLLSRLC